MRVHRPAAVLIITAALLTGGGTAAFASSTAAATTSPAAQPVSAFVAWQACRAGVWEWIAKNAALGTTVGHHMNKYSSSLEWRQSGGWFVQISGTAHEVVLPGNQSSYCLVKGTNANPKITDYAYPR